MTSQLTDDTSTQERARQAASTAAEESRHVAGTATEQATQVASEAADAAKNVAQDAVRNLTDTAREQGGAQRDRLVGTLTSLTEDLSGMADQAPPGLAGDLARQAADHARSITSRLENRDPGEILDDVRRFARQRPGVFLLGALAAGVVTGRLLAGARDGIAAAEAAPGGSTTGVTTPTGSTGSPRGTLDGDPLAGTTLPSQPAVPADTGLLDGPEAGYGSGGLAGGTR
jgi:hypothetical protein